jgi:hypothetical protein
LIAPRLGSQAPFAEVLAVVGEKVIAVFADARQRPLDDFRATE